MSRALQATGGAKRGYFQVGCNIFQAKLSPINREIEAQLFVSMLLLDTAADEIIRRAVNHQSSG
jgi:hypothetical protein